MDMNQVLDGDETQVELPQQVEGKEQEGAQAPAGEGQGEPTSPRTDGHVPLAALEAVRGERKDWKEKALRLEGELKAMREQGQRQQQPQQREPQDPIQAMQQQFLHERFNTSEMLAREKYPDLDEKVAIFEEAAAKNPALTAELMRQPHPYAYLHKEATRIALQREMGDDPAAFKTKLREQYRAEFLAEQGQEAGQGSVTAKPLPTSLAAARSAGARGATWTGPPPLDAILK